MSEAAHALIDGFFSALDVLATTPREHSRRFCFGALDWDTVAQPRYTLDPPAITTRADPRSVQAT